MVTTRKAWAAGAAWILVVAALATMLALQGWRASVLTSETLPYIDAARALLADGRLPDRGDVTSLHAFAPPGFAWVMAPGFAVPLDARLVDVPAWTLLYIGMLTGVFLLAREVGGARVAVLAVALAGLGEPGLRFAGSLNMVGSAGASTHPGFYVWIAYWTHLWVTRRDPRYFAVACFTWVIAMWMFMSSAPALFMIVAAWMVYRPPVLHRWLAAAAVLAAIIWLPYLRFEASRGFADISAQLLRYDITPPDGSTLCNPSLMTRQWPDTRTAMSPTAPTASPGTQGPVARAGARVLSAARGLTGNFESAVPGTEFLLLGLVALGLGVAMRASPPAIRERPADARSIGLDLVAGGLLALACLLDHRLVSNVLHMRLGPYAISSIGELRGLVALAGIVLLWRRGIATLVDHLRRHAATDGDAARIIAIVLIVPWAILLLVVEPGRQDRFLAVWPLQAIVLAFVVAALPRARRAAIVAVCLLVFVNPLAVSQVVAWRDQGWAGSDSAETRVADYVAAQIQRNGAPPAIGYRLFTEGPPTPAWMTMDPQWKLGEQFDAALRYGHGIANADRCVEGVSADDVYRVVEPSPSSPSALNYIDAPMASFRIIGRVAGYDIYKRD